MASTGIRELRQRASELLRRVEAGETIEITDRGRPVAVLAPLPDQGPTAQLLARGELVAAEDTLASLPAPLPLGGGGDLPSRVLERLRDDDR